MDAIYKTKYDTIQDSKNYNKKILAVVIVIVVVYAIILGWVYSNSKPHYDSIVLIGIFLFGVGLIGLGHFWISLPIESVIFEHIFKALKALERFETGSEKHYLKRATNQLKKASFELKNFSTPEDIHSLLFYHEFSSRFSSLSKNILSKIIPRISNGDDLVKMQSILKNLAKIFGEIYGPITLDKIDPVNENMRSIEELPSKIIEKPITLKKVYSHKVTGLVIAFTSGFLLLFSITYVSCILLDLDLVNLLRSNLFTFIGAGIGASSLIAGVLIFKK